MTEFSEEALRARFAVLRKREAAILDKAAPLREERDRFVAANRAREEAMNSEIEAAEPALYDLRMELSRLCRALGGKTGPVA